jgi:uroporphyrinogen decarboxylase
MLIKDVFGSVNIRKPIWLMRQAGRYLPEYKNLRKNFPDFMDFCFNKKAIVESTLQPLRRFDFDAAIIFSDILTIPHVLGQKVQFIEGVGPILQEIANWKSWTDNAEKKLDNFLLHYQNQFDAIKVLKNTLSKDKALIGFCGSPWTILCYMVESKKSTDFSKLKSLINKDKILFSNIINLMVNFCAKLLIAQVESGCDVVQIFDTWGYLCSQDYIDLGIVNPILEMVNLVRLRFPDLPVVYYGRKNFEIYKHFYHLKNFGLSLGDDIDIEFAVQNIPDNLVIQGNFSSLDLVNGNFDNVHRVLNATKERKSIFNLGHGVLPQTPLQNVEKLTRIVKDFIG